MTLDHRIKSTLGITGWSLSRVPIDGVVRHLDVDSSHPGAAHGPKGSGVHRLMRYVSWVKNVIFTFFLRFLFERFEFIQLIRYNYYNHTEGTYIYSLFSFITLSS